MLLNSVSQQAPPLYSLSINNSVFIALFILTLRQPGWAEDLERQCKLSILSYSYKVKSYNTTRLRLAGRPSLRLRWPARYLPE